MPVVPASLRSLQSASLVRILSIDDEYSGDRTEQESLIDGVVSGVVRSRVV